MLVLYFTSYNFLIEQLYFSSSLSMFCLAIYIIITDRAVSISSYIFWLNSMFDIKKTTKSICQYHNYTLLPSILAIAFISSSQHQLFSKIRLVQFPDLNSLYVCPVCQFIIRNLFKVPASLRPGSPAVSQGIGRGRRRICGLRQPNLRH